MAKQFKLYVGERGGDLQYETSLLMYNTKTALKVFTLDEAKASRWFRPATLKRMETLRPGTHVQCRTRCRDTAYYVILYQESDLDREVSSLESEIADLTQKINELAGELVTKRTKLQTKLTKAQEKQRKAVTKL